MSAGSGQKVTRSPISRIYCMECNERPVAASTAAAAVRVYFNEMIELR